MARIWHNGRAESIRRADMVLRVPSGRADWLADGTKEGFCNYLSGFKLRLEGKACIDCDKTSYEIKVEVTYTF